MPHTTLSIGAFLGDARRRGVAEIDAEVLAAAALQARREFVISNTDFVPSLRARRRMQRYLIRRKRGEPVAHILRYREFFGMQFMVNRSVLIPRPETEHLVEETIRIAHRMPRPRIWDIGTGSGAIAVSLARYLRSALVVATDISARALSVAKKNAHGNGVHERIKFIKSNLLSDVEDVPVDIIVANLPYIDPCEKLDSSVAHFEPHRALYGGIGGVEIIGRLLGQIAARTCLPSHILLEIGLGQADALSSLKKKYFGNASMDFKNDLAGIARVCMITVCTKN